MSGGGSSVVVDVDGTDADVDSENSDDDDDGVGVSDHPVPAGGLAELLLDDELVRLGMVVTSRARYTSATWLVGRISNKVVMSLILISSSSDGCGGVWLLLWKMKNFKMSCVSEKAMQPRLSP